MCRYIYVYSSTCQHGDFFRVTYCTKTKALDLSRHGDSHSSNVSRAHECSRASPSASSSHPPNSSTTNRTSPVHSPKQHHSIMSAFSTIEIGPPFPYENSVAAQDKQAARHVAFVPESAFDNALQTCPVDDPFKSSREGRKVPLPSHTQPTLSMRLPQNSEATQLVARLTSNNNGSSAAKISHSQQFHTSASTAHLSSDDEVENVPGHSEENTRREDEHREACHSPRKPIPAHWLPRCNGPNLATAQRAKKRSQRKDSQNSSPVEVKALRGARSSFDIAQKAVTPEGASFLTKEALAAVENNITTPKSPCNQGKFNKTPSKSDQSSPNVSPVRSSPRQSTFKTKTSPTKTSFLSTTAASAMLSCAPSSTASMSGNSFYTPNGSPVRSYAGSEVSFQSAKEFFDDDYTFDSNGNADGEKAQIVQSLRKTRPSPSATTVKANESPTRPKLTLIIPPINAKHASDDSAVILISPPSGTTTTVRSPNIDMSLQSSRIPRAPGASRSERARGATRSSILKRVQSTESSLSREKAQALNGRNSVHSHPSSPDPDLASRHILTVDSSVQTEPNDFEELQAKLDGSKDAISVQPTTKPSVSIEESSESSKDPVLMDSAIIYSRKKTEVNDPLDMNETSDSGHPIAFSDPAILHLRIMPPQKDTEVSKINEPAPPDSKHPKSCSSGSDLRATAAEFVPQAIPAGNSASFGEKMVISDQPCLQPPGTDIFGLDPYEIPWLYYMYPIQFAYEQGFRNGRSTSPKKFRAKKHRSSIPLSDETHYSPRRDRVPELVSKRENAPPYTNVQHESPTILTTRSSAAVDDIQTQEKRLGYQADFAIEDEPGNTLYGNGSGTPFSSQLEIINQQATLNDRTNHQTPRLPNVDLTSIRNVNLSYIPQKTHRPNYYAFPRRSQRQGNRYADNGLYGGRGPSGVPMDATMPFPDPIPPPNRLDFFDAHQISPKPYLGYSIGVEACGMVEIGTAAEKGGGEACNVCAPDH